MNAASRPRLSRRRHAFLLVQLIGLALLVAPPAYSQAPPPSPEEEFRALETALVGAMHRKDREALERLLAPGYVLRATPDDVDRETWLTNAIALCWGERFDLDDFSVRRQGTTAIVAFVLTFYSDPITCRPARLGSLITDVWVEGPAGWQLAVRHSGPASEAGVATQYALVPERPPVFQTSGEVSFVATSGNASTATLGLSAQAERRFANGATSGRVAFVRSEAEAEETARSLALQVRQGRELSPRLEFFARGNYLADRFAGIEHRTSADAGINYRLTGPPHEVAVSGGLGGTVELRLDAADRRSAIATGGLSYRWVVRTVSRVTAETASTANLEDPADWRLSTDLSLVTELNRTMAVKLTYGIRFVNEPVPGFGRTDTSAAASLVFSYARRP